MLANNGRKVLTAGLKSSLERKFIEEFLANKGFLLEDIKNLPTETGSKLMTSACLYASLRLTEIESRARFCKRIQYVHSS